MNKSLFFFVSLFAIAVHASDEIGQVSLLKRRITLLESALAPANPKALASLFAEAVKQRNGAVQYMLFCPDLQKKYSKMFQELNWVTGTSSPSFADYKVTEVSTNQFQINFSMSLQGKPAGTTLDKLGVIALESAANPVRHWCIGTYTRQD